MSFTDDTYINQVPISVIGKLKCLDTNDAYRKVVAALDDANLDRPPLDRDFVDDLDNAFKKQRSPTAILFQELGQKGYRVSDLKCCFRLSQQIRALEILEGGDTTTGLIEGRGASPGRPLRDGQPHFKRSQSDNNNRARQLPSYNPPPPHPPPQQPRSQPTTPSEPQDLHGRTIEVSAANMRHYDTNMFPASDSDDESVDESQKAGAPEAIVLNQPGDCRDTPLARRRRTAAAAPGGGSGGDGPELHNLVDSGISGTSHVSPFPAVHPVKSAERNWWKVTSLLMMCFMFFLIVYLVLDRR